MQNRQRAQTGPAIIANDSDVLAKALSLDARVAEIAKRRHYQKPRPTARCGSAGSGPYSPQPLDQKARDGFLRAASRQQIPHGQQPTRALLCFRDRRPRRRRTLCQRTCYSSTSGRLCISTWFASRPSSSPCISATSRQRPQVPKAQQAQMRTHSQRLQTSVSSASSPSLFRRYPRSPATSPNLPSVRRPIRTNCGNNADMQSVAHHSTTQHAQSSCGAGHNLAVQHVTMRARAANPVLQWRVIAGVRRRVCQGHTTVHTLREAAGANGLFP